MKLGGEMIDVMQMGVETGCMFPQKVAEAGRSSEILRCSPGERRWRMMNVSELLG